MAKINLNNVTSPQNVSVMNDNFQKIMVALDEQVLYRDNPEGEPNQMENNLDMNGKRIYNLPVPIADNEPLRKADAALIVTELNQEVIDALEGAEEALEAVAPAIAASLANSTAALNNVNEFIEDVAEPSGSSMVGFLQAGTGAQGRTLQDKLRDIVNVFDFMSPAQIADVKAGSLAVDVTASIQAAIDALPATGGTVSLPAGKYRVSAPINIGNGNGGATYSTKNGIRLIGDGAGFAHVPPVEIVYTGTNVANYLIRVNGRISDVQLSGFFLNLQGNIGGIQMRAFSGCEVSKIKIVNPRTATDALHIIGGTAPTGNYNIYNKFSQISIGLLSPTSGGLYCDGDYASINDTWLTTFDLIRIETVAGATNSVCARMRFIDSVTFTRCHFESSGEPTSTGLTLDALGNPGFGNDYPMGLAFYDCSIKNVVVLEDATSKIGPTYFYGHGQNDNEVLPSHPRLFGVTANGEVFGFMTGFKHKVATDLNVQNTTTATNVFSYTVADHMLGGTVARRPVSGGLRIQHFGNYINTSGANANLTLVASLGGAILHTVAFTAIPTGASGRTVQFDFSLFLSQNNLALQAGQATATMGAVGSGVGTMGAPFATLTGSSATTANSAVANVLTISVQHSVAAGTIAYTSKNTVLELL